MSSLDPKDKALFDKLTSVAIDTLWGTMHAMGYSHMFIEGVRPFHKNIDRKMAGRALTMRYLPARKDLAEQVSKSNPYPLFVRAAEESKPGTVMVVEIGSTNGGFWGDVILTRFMMAGGVGIVTDGAIRDLAQIREMDVAVYAREVHAAAGWQIVATDLNIPVHCSNVAVLPGDVIVGDAEGVVVIPAHIAEEVADKAIYTEAKENYIRGKLLKGSTIFGVYPPNDAITKEFEAWRKSQA